MSTYKQSAWAFLVLAALGAVPAAAQGLVKLEVFPPDIHLDTTRDKQSFIAVATRADGVTLDVSASAAIAIAQPELVRVEGRTLYAAADGQTTLTATYEGLTATVPVVVQNAAADRPISFKLDVMPVFMRAGCNSGRCHGAARGKDGFRLSLFGYDPDGAIAIECNIAPGYSINRQAMFGGFARMRACTLLAYHARRWLEENVPEGSRWRAQDGRAQAASATSRSPSSSTSSP